MLLPTLRNELPMRNFSRSILWSLIALHFSTLASAQDDWSRWRGPSGNGIAVADQQPPTSWSADQNVVWKVPVPGRGHSSPIVVGDKIFLATADEEQQTQSVVCFERQTGQQQWQTELNQGGFDRKIHSKNTHASGTIATDGTQVYCVFSHHGSVNVTALSLTGEIQWQKKVGPYQSQYPFGFGASPIVHEGMVIVPNQNDAESCIIAFDATNGEQKWRTDADKQSSYSTPVVAETGGKSQLLLSGANIVAAYDPANGKQLWKTPTKWQVSCGTLVWNKDRVFASGGYPASQTLAVNADGSGSLVWENTQKAYEQSMLIHEGFLYAHCDNGAVYCWRESDGQEMWKQRFSAAGNPAQSASPVLANGNIYFTAENGETLVIKASSDKLTEISRNNLGNEAFASMAVCGNQIFSRIAINDPDNDTRQEWLFCLGETATERNEKNSLGRNSPKN